MPGTIQFKTPWLKGKSAASCRRVWCTVTIHARLTVPLHPHLSLLRNAFPHNTLLQREGVVPLQLTVILFGRRDASEFCPHLPFSSHKTAPSTDHSTTPLRQRARCEQAKAPNLVERVRKRALHDMTTLGRWGQIALWTADHRVTSGWTCSRLPEYHLLGAGTRISAERKCHAYKIETAGSAAPLGRPERSVVDSDNCEQFWRKSRWRFGR